MKNVWRTGALALVLWGCGKDGNDGGDTDTDVGADTEIVDTQVSDTDTSDSDTDVAAEPTCASYCAAVTAACTDALSQYPTVEACVAFCNGSGMAAGTLLDTSGNTIGCRTYHATAAVAAPATHCPHAGLLGGGVCGDPIENFCAFDLHACTGDDAAYASAGVCETAAAGWDVGTPGESSGDTLSCRVYHLGAAIVGGDTTTHCPHTAADGGGVCVDVL